MTIGRGEYPDIPEVLDKMGRRVKKLVAIDADASAHEAGSILSLNMVMLGAMSKHCTLPIEPKHLKKAITGNTKASFLDINLKAFNLGYNS